jgi:small multidrug resistance pump
MSETLLRRLFRAAALYNIAWGTTMVFYPNLMFDFFGLRRLNYPFVMSGMALCIGLFGYAYWVVAQDLRRYPQMVVIGFLGKTLGPIGWLWTVIAGVLPLRTMWINVFNDLVWLPFFIGYFVWYRRHRGALSGAVEG